MFDHVKMSIQSNDNHDSEIIGLQTRQKNAFSTLERLQSKSFKERTHVDNAVKDTWPLTRMTILTFFEKEPFVEEKRSVIESIVDQVQK